MIEFHRLIRAAAAGNLFSPSPFVRGGGGGGAEVTDAYNPADDLAYIKKQGGDPMFNGYEVFDNLYDVKSFAAPPAVKH